MKIFGKKDIQFNNIVGQIQSYLSESIGGNNSINKSSVFGQILTIISAAIHNAILYIEDALVEQNKYTAQRKKSIYALASGAGYEPSPGRAAGVLLQLSHKPNNKSGLSVILKEHERLICSQNGLYYNLVLGQSGTVIKTGSGLVNTTLYAVQGKFESQRFTSTGGALYSVNFTYNGYIDLEYISVDVNGEEATKYDSLYDMPPNTLGFWARFNPVSGIDLVFGNGKFGKTLDQGDVIDITYLVHDGESGNLEVDSNTSFSFIDSLTDISGDEVEGNEMFVVSFATDDAVSSGSNAESLSQVRYMIGYNSRSLVLSDEKSYNAFINRFSFCGYNRTWSEPGSMVTSSIIMRNYKLGMESGSDYFNLTESDFILSDAQKESIQNALESSGRMLAGSIYNILDVEICKYALYLYVTLKSTATDKEMVREKIRESVGNFFGDISSDSYIPKSDIIASIKEDVEEVDGLNCYFLSEKNEEAINNLGYTEKTTKFDASTSTYITTETEVGVLPGENPSLGLDSHGNISIDSDTQFPVLMGGWSWTNDEGQDVVVEVGSPLIIVFE